MSGTKPIVVSEPDVLIVDHGTVVQFHMKSKSAINWMVENLHYEPWQMLGATVLCVDHRYASDIIQVAQDQGLTVEVANGRKNAE